MSLAVEQSKGCSHVSEFCMYVQLIDVEGPPDVLGLVGRVGRVVMQHLLCGVFYYLHPEIISVEY